MRLAITLALMMTLTSAASSFAAECESRLVASLASVTERALEQGKLTLEQVREMASSEKPLNPLRFVTPNTDTLALRQFFELNLSSVKNWSAVRHELRQVLARFGAVDMLRAEAVRATERVISPKLVCSHTGKISDWLETKSGRMLFLFQKDNRLEVRDPSQVEPIWKGPSANIQALAESEDGHPLLYLYGVGYGTRDVMNYEYVVVDLVTGQREQKRTTQFDFSYNTVTYQEKSFDLTCFPRGELGSFHLVQERAADTEPLTQRNLHLWRKNASSWTQVNSHPLEFVNGLNEQQLWVREFADGSVAVAGVNGKLAPDLEHITYYSPFIQEPSEPLILNAAGAVVGHGSIKIIHSRDNRILILAVGVTANRNIVQIFDPAKGTHPIWQVEVSDNIAHVEAVEFQGEIILGVAFGGQLQIYGSRSTRPLFEMPLGERYQAFFDRLFVSGDQVYAVIRKVVMVPGPSSLRAYDFYELFARRGQ